MNQEEERKVWRRALEIAAGNREYFEHRTRCVKCADCDDAPDTMNYSASHFLKIAAVECGVELPPLVPIPKAQEKDELHPAHYRPVPCLPNCDCICGMCAAMRVKDWGKHT